MAIRVLIRHVASVMAFRCESLMFFTEMAFPITNHCLCLFLFSCFFYLGLAVVEAVVVAVTMVVVDSGGNKSGDLTAAGH